MTHLNVAVRVRPLSDRETELKSIPIVEIVSHNVVAVTNLKVLEHYAGDSRERVRRFSFDYCFDGNSTQEQVFEAVEEVIGNAVRKRYHSCVFAYGQSSSGKTHTITGMNDDPGLTPRLCQRIFDYLTEENVEEDDAKGVTVSYLEIYNEKVKDLLVADDNENNVSSLKVREHPTRGTYVQGLTHHRVGDSEGLLHWFRVGNKKRRVSATSINQQSSRSHSVFTVTCFGGVKLNLVDLAGSERTGSRSFNNSSTFREGANINKSLVALGNVIFALADHSKNSTKAFSRRRYVPYRDSVLTWLLKDTLGGNSKTIMIATISPSNTCYNETVNTLRFGHRAKQIISQPIVNEDPKQKTIRDLRTEVARLKELLLTHQINPLPDSVQQQASDVVRIGVSDGVLEKKTTTTNQSTNTDICLYRNDDKDVLFDQIKLKLRQNACKLLNDDEVFDEIVRRISNATNLITVSGIGFQARAEISDAIYQNISDYKKLNATQIYNVPQFKVFVCAKDQVDSCKREILCSTTDKLIPVMDVTTAVSKSEKPPVKLRRTFSVSSADMESNKAKMYGSYETLSNGAKPAKTQPTQLRKRSLDKSTSSLKREKSSVESIPEKTKNGAVATETKGLAKVEARVDSIRKTPVKPRAEIVAAVTHRLYAKVKKKEVATETDDIIREHRSAIARIRLQDISQRALRACRRKHVETQTDSRPVLRVKETSTDVQDLQIDLIEMRHATVATQEITTQDVAINCNHLESFDNSNASNHVLVLTKSCGTQANVEESSVKMAQNNLLSFTKYLRAKREPKITANPIYTSSVNINVSHNYMNGGNKRDSLSGDSLDEQSTVCLPTPDLISNHNSLETQQNDGAVPTKDVDNINYASSSTAIPENEATADCFATPSYEPEANDSTFGYLQIYEPKTYKLKAKDVGEALVVSEQPVVLKSIMKQNNGGDPSDCASDFSNSDLSLNAFENVPDSLNYHFDKSVRFNEETVGDRILEAMANFLKEATGLVTNLTSVTNRFDCDRTYDLQVTVTDANDVLARGTKHRKRPRRRKTKKDEASQTSPKRTFDKSSEVPENKYEHLVRNACDRLERCSNKFSTGSDWPAEYRSLQPEDSSMDSNVTFSDYGSLPRQKEKHRPVYSPRAYLRELTSMRKLIIDSSREELVHETNTHVD